MEVDISLTVKAVDGRKVQFELAAKDGAEEISRGEHGRFVVEVEKLRARVAQKAAKAAGR
jgi:predicted thioesterase